MDKSVDSIGSCSLDVEADTTDFSDTSGSLNFPTQVTTSKNIAGLLTTNINNCSTQLSTVVVKAYDSTFRESLVMSEPKPNAVDLNGAPITDNSNTLSNADDELCDKKPSYLNLACCVNGYSNLTTYDSKIRQDINKSREVSPIRPSSSSIHYCKKSNSLVPPLLHSMPNTFVAKNNGSQENVLISFEEKTEENEKNSFIKQRVERLYGPGALAQGFYSPRKAEFYKTRSEIHSKNQDGLSNSELTRKFKELSPSKDYSQIKKNLNKVNRIQSSVLPPSVENIKNDSVDLPVLRHLSQEFRAQLPAISPKRGYINSFDEKDNLEKDESHSDCGPSEEADVVDKKLQCEISIAKLLPDNIIELQETEIKNDFCVTSSIVRDGNYFLSLLKTEQTRLLSLAADSEKYIDALSNNIDIGEDVLGFLRSASGKARLLVNKKMKQFEGLCHNNLNRSPEDKFPTTCDDLQGFWDMVNLQIDHIDSIFKEIENLRNNEWKKPKELEPPIIDISTPTKTPKPLKTVSVRAKVNGKKSEISPAMAAAALKRETQRKQLLEMKRKKKLEMAAILAPNDDQSPSIFVEDKNSIDFNIIERIS